MEFCKGLLTAAIAASLVSPATALAEPAAGMQVQRAKIKVHPKRLWRGYGFLPGYRQPDVDFGVPRPGPQRLRTEQRYYSYTGQVQYGWGYPGFYRGRWNGGSFGPCWTSTPIGMMPTCGQ